MNKCRQIILISAVVISLYGCAAAQKMSRDEVFRQHATIGQLDAKVTAAAQRDVDSLAPGGFNSAQNHLSVAISGAQANRPDLALEAARKGLSDIEHAQADAEVSRELFVEVLENRSRAVRAGAPDLFPAQLARLENDLRKATRLVEEGKIEEAKRKRPELINAYSQLELRSLKEGTVRAAESAIDHAEAEKADKYAPKTFKQAQDELVLAVSVLEANRSDLDKAGTHARKAAELADKSIYIAELIKDFDRRDFTEEEKVLWYQEQLAIVNEPLGEPLQFHQPNRSMVRGVKDSITRLVESARESSEQLAASEARVAELLSAKEEDLAKLQSKYEQELAAKAREREALERSRQETQRRFEYVQSLFDEPEASVYLQRQNVLISAHGFYFPSGIGEIEAVNFSLLNKIVLSIRNFPHARVIVSGHTDSTGEPNVNQALSEVRAENVARFLVEIGGVEGGVITTQGFGEARPIATNETMEGRKLNRRIEVLIVNE